VLVSKEQNVEIYSPSRTGGQGNLKTYVCFSWLPLEAVQPIINDIISVKNIVFGRN
jgi:hypothetical protein